MGGGTVTDLRIQVAEAVSQVADVVTTVAGTANSEAALVDRLRAVNLSTQSAEQTVGLHFLKEGSNLPEDSPLGTSAPAHAHARRRRH
jgi:hypothetical protein